MARMLLTSEQVKDLMINPYVESVTECRIVYSDEFKRKFVEEYRLGKGPRQIFKDAGFDVDALGYKRIERASDRWRRANNEGVLGDSIDLVEVHENRNRSHESLKQKCDRLEFEVEQLRAQLARLQGQ